jgi:hypothetical protein
MSEAKTYPIGQFRKAAGRIALEDGSAHDVMQIKSRIRQTLKAATAETYIDLMTAAVRELVPTLTDAQDGELTDEDRNDIIAIAGLGVEAVERIHAAALKNGDSPAADGSTSPGSPPMTTTAPSSSSLPSG